MPKFTTEDLLSYLYDEMSADQKTQMKKELQTNWALQQKYQVLEEAKNRLSRIKLSSPRKQTLTSIMKYAEENMHISN